jgi:hypothetical protein
MERGNISNEVSPRLVIAFEGMLGLLPDKPDSRVVELMRRQFGSKSAQVKRAINSYTINEQLAHVIWDTTWRYKYSVDVVTYLGEEFAEALTERLDTEGLPIGRVWADDPKKLARRIAHMPDVAAIFDNENHLMFGSKGRTLPAHPTTLIGSLFG